MSQKNVDIIFVIDATSSNDQILEQLYNQCHDIGTLLSERAFRSRVKPSFGAVLMRDPVDTANKLCGKDEHDHTDGLNSSLEAMAVLLESVNADFDENTVPLAHGGGDEPEDWFGALKIAYDMTKDRESKKLIVVISDENAHGEEYCGVPNHNEEGPKLDNLINEFVRNRVYMLVINVKKRDDQGCQTTINRLTELYKNCPELFNSESLHIDIDENGRFKEADGPEDDKEFDFTKTFTHSFDNGRLRNFM